MASTDIEKLRRDHEPEAVRLHIGQRRSSSYLGNAVLGAIVGTAKSRFVEQHWLRAGLETERRRLWRMELGSLCEDLPTSYVRALAPI